MEIANSHIVPEGVSPVRLTEYLLQIAADFLQGTTSRNYVKKLIKNGNIKVDGIPASTAIIVLPHMKIELFEADQKPPKIYNLKFPVIYEDDYLAVINKPAGIVVSGNRFRTVENALLNNLQKSSQSDALNLLRPAHRLDALTSGLLLIAKTRSVRYSLGEMFSNQEIEKTYKAIVIGKTQKMGVIDLLVNDQPALTEYHLLKTTPSLKCEWLSLLEVKPKTGRTHQIRIHLAGSGFPILGDKLYGEEKYLFKGKGLFLCAVGLKFKHPLSGEILDLQIEEPSKFHLHLEREEKRYFKFK